MIRISKRGNFIRCIKAVASLFLVGLLISGIPCYAQEQGTGKVTISMIGKYDSADTASIRSVDAEKRQIRLRNHKTGKTYTLSYDNTSMMYDIRGTVLSASLLEPGQIVDVKFLKSTKLITSLNVNGDAWVIENTRDHELTRGDGTARIKGDLFKIDARTLVMAEGNLALAEDILATDTITAYGIDREIYSIVVTGGHGYVSLSSDVVEQHSLVGAWIELDNEVIHRISPNMLLSAPEGDYNLQIIGNGASYQSEINISRNQETVVDTSKVKISKPKEGMVTFEITPDTAEVFVDGEKMLNGVPQSVKYGYHSLKVMAEGYLTQNKYLKVGTAKSVVQIELEKEEDESSASSQSVSEASSSASSAASSQAGSTSGSSYAASKDRSSSAVSAASKYSSVQSAQNAGSANANKVIEGYKIYFDEPYGAEVYFDGTYIGMVPTSITKISGSHEVILKKDGRQTKSYRVNVDSEEVSLNYTFPELVKINGGYDDIEEGEYEDEDVTDSDGDDDDEEVVIDLGEDDAEVSQQEDEEEEDEEVVIILDDNEDTEVIAGDEDAGDEEAADEETADEEEIEIIEDDEDGTKESAGGEDDET